MPEPEFCRFLTSLFEEGRVTVAPFAPLPQEELTEAGARIAEFERRYRQEIPGDAPAYSAVAALWAGTSFYRACQFASTAVETGLLVVGLKEVLKSDIELPTIPKVVFVCGPVADIAEDGREACRC